jgi:hypothetical protein
VPIEGVSLAYSFEDPNAKERHTTQYFEIAGNRAIYSDGWLARTIHRAPWEREGRRPLDSDVWELFDTRADFSLASDLAAREPTRLADLKTLFMVEAEKHHVLPLDDRLFERAIASMVGRPDLMAGRTSLTLGQGMTGMMENVFLNVKNKSKTITAEIEVPASGGHGAILVQGGRFGGWALYVKDGKPAYDYNFLGLMRYTVAASKPLSQGRHTVTLDFAYDGGGMAKGGTATLLVDGKQAARGRVEHTQPMMFSADETADVGIDLGTPVVEAIGSEERSRFTGWIGKVTIEVRDANAKADAATREGQRTALQRME